MPDYNTSDTYQPMTFDKIRIGLASPEKIREWSHGEVTKPETINYRTLKPERDGLFCEKIFGPSKDWECHCGKYKKIRYKGVVCDRCGVEVTKSSVRRERMGHIELAAPVSHIWYFKGIPSRMHLMLDISPRNLEKVLYFAAYVVTDKGDTGLMEKQVLSDKEYREAREKYGDSFKAGMGAEAIKELLLKIDLDKDAEELREELKSATGQKKEKIIKRLDVIEAFRASGNKPEWMVMDVIPVIPPDIRPMVQLDGGRFATSDLNDLYRRIINRNNRLKKLIDQNSPDIIVRNEKRMLQEAVDALIDNGRRGRPVTGPGNRALKSLSDMLKGKQGRFRQNLLGKRVDYSGRSVIVIGPELKIYQCGLPKEMAIELFKPFVMKELVQNGSAHNIKSAKKMVERLQPEVWDILEHVITEHPVMLNRAPTLHRLGIQSFEPVLVEGRAIKLHPLVCGAYNADFDGDQMAVHVPLFVEAQAESRFLMLSPNNLLKPSDGAPVAVPTQDMVLGIYWLTLRIDGERGEGKTFKDINEAIMAYENNIITLQAGIKVRMSKKDKDGALISRIVDTTLGRLLFNEVIPQDLGFVDRTDPDNQLLPEIDFLVKKGNIKEIIDRCIHLHGATIASEMLDNIKAIGYKYSTVSAITVSVSDMVVPEDKEALLAEAEKTIEDVTRRYRRGMSTDEERYKAVIKAWEVADEKITKALLEDLDQYNNIFMMADSGARGSDKQIKQLAGMRGLMSDTQGRTIELPIKSNFREGLDVLEYFISAHGARKGLSDTALRTADSGYLTRRLVDVSQDLLIRETDCCEGTGMIPGMYVETYTEKRKSSDGEEKEPEKIETLRERITGRFAAEDVLDPDTGKEIAAANTMITPEKAEIIVNKGIEKVKIRTVLSCRSHIGICSKCYGANMATGQTVQVGEAVGIIAAQSIGEPGTQLTMRTFHTGGVAGDDITQGLPRVEELFEARKPKGVAIISDLDGTVELRDNKKKREVVVTNSESGESKSYVIPYTSTITVKEGQEIEAGDSLTSGSINPHDLLRIKGLRSVQDYILKEVQKVYRLQGVDINDKHIEIIVHQMLKKIKIDDPGDSKFLPGAMIDVLDFEDINEALEAEGSKPAKGTRIVLGITKASLATNSFLSAASFQETTKVLTDAAIKGKVDPLIGLKENVLIGKLIPAGTGMKRYRHVKLDTDERIEREKEERAVMELAGENAESEATAVDDILEDGAPVMAETAEEALDIPDELANMDLSSVLSDLDLDEDPDEE